MAFHVPCLESAFQRHRALPADRPQDQLEWQTEWQVMLAGACPGLVNAGVGSCFPGQASDQQLRSLAAVIHGKEKVYGSIP